MIIEQISTIIIMCIYVGCLGHAIWTDITKMKISNSVSLILLAIFIPFAALHIEMSAIAIHIAIAGAVFAVAFGLYVLHAMGGGDVKLITASALWIGPQHVLLFLMTTALLGGIIALCLIVLRRALPQHAASSRWRFLQHTAKWSTSGQLPYGVPISIAALSLTHVIFGRGLAS